MLVWLLIPRSVLKILISPLGQVVDHFLPKTLGGLAPLIISHGYQEGADE